MNSIQWQGNGVRPEIAAQVIEFLKKNIPSLSQLALKSIFGIVVELLANVTNHAYVELTEIKPTDGWQITITENPETVLVSVKDWGISIPESVRRKHLIPFPLKLNLDKTLNEDCLLIYEAIYKRFLPATTRGMGLTSLLSSADRKNISGFLIKSGNGTYRYLGNKNFEFSEIMGPRFEGTLVQLEIPNLGPTREI